MKENGVKDYTVQKCAILECPCHKPDEPKAWRERATYVLRLLGVEDHITGILKIIENEKAETAQRARMEMLNEVGALMEKELPLYRCRVEASRVLNKLKGV